MGATYLAVAAEHPLAARVRNVIPRWPGSSTSAAAWVRAGGNRGHGEKRPALGVEALHPITSEALPVWVANFVLMGYGTGAVMAVPAHDSRDYEFARRYGLPIKQVVFPGDALSADVSEAAFIEPGVLRNSGAFDGLSSAAAFAAIAEHLRKSGKGRRKVNYRLRDWGVSRQRYWGCPIPMLNCPRCGPVPVPEEQLPVVLPEEVEFQGVVSPIKRMPEFYQARCPACGGTAERETDTLDTFSDPRGITRVTVVRTAPSACSMIGSATGCPWINTSAAWSMPCCICSTPGFSTSSCATREWRSMRSLSRACLPKGWC